MPRLEMTIPGGKKRKAISHHGWVVGDGLVLVLGTSGRILYLLSLMDDPSPASGHTNTHS